MQMDCLSVRLQAVPENVAVQACKSKPADSVLLSIACRTALQAARPSGGLIACAASQCAATTRQLQKSSASNSGATP